MNLSHEKIKLKNQRKASLRIPMKSARDYDPNRPPVPGQSGHL
jgi:hypothetical protein